MLGEAGVEPFRQIAQITRDGVDHLHGPVDLPFCTVHRVLDRAAPFGTSSTTAAAIETMCLLMRQAVRANAPSANSAPAPPPR